MFCGNCGTQCPDGTKFCAKCGNPLQSGGQTSQNQFSTPNNFNNGLSNGFNNVWNSIKDTTSVRSPHPAVNQLKKMATSPLFLIAIIAFSLSILITLFSSGSIITSAFEQIEDILYESGLGYAMDLSELGKFFEIFDRISFTSAFISSIPNIVLAVGMWLIFAHGLDKRSEYMKTSGFTTIKVICVINKVMLIIYTIITAIVFAVILKPMFESLSELRDTSYGDSISTGISIIVVIALIIIAILVFFTVVWSKIVKALDGFKYIAATGTPYFYFSKFVAVMCFVWAGGNLLGIAFTGFTGVLMITSLICFGILIFYINSVMLNVSRSLHQDFVKQQAEADRAGEAARQAMYAARAEQQNGQNNQ